MLFHRAQTVLIVGCGRLGASLAGTLCERGAHVTVIDRTDGSFRKLPESFSGYELTGDGTDTDLLERCGIGSADMVIAATESDNVNSLIAQIASRIYHVEQVYIRLNDTEKEKLIRGYNIRAIFPFKLSVDEFERLSQPQQEAVK